jgi:hypothetical protein
MHDRQLDRTQRGPRWLRNRSTAASFIAALHHGERVRNSYQLFAWVVMPNHLHVVLKPHEKLSSIMRWLKWTTSAGANRIIGQTGRFRYVEENPMTAALVSRAEEWPWSSTSNPTGGKIAGATPGESGMA